MFWFAADGWERNPPSGIDSRLLVGGGVGNIWYENDRGHFRTSYGINYTWESWTNGTSDNYLGGNVTANWLWKFSPNASFQTVDTLFLNFFTWSDWRINSNNSLTVQMYKMLALEGRPDLPLRQRSADRRVPGLRRHGRETRSEPCRWRLDKLDTIFTTALVIGF